MGTVLVAPFFVLTKVMGMVELHGVVKYSKGCQNKKRNRNISYDIKGINRQTIFEDEEDASKFIGTLKKYIKTYRSKQKYSFKIIASKLII